MLLLFWLCATLVFYTYVGYPCAIWALARSIPTPLHIRAQSNTPSVSIVVAVYNERDRIERKLATLAQLDYPAERTQWVFASDGSTDGTNEILRVHPRVEFVECARGGKATALNAAVEHAAGDILVFTDARQELSPDSVTHLVRALSDPTVGTVSGDLVHRDPTTGAAHSIGLYWRYERFIRMNESTYFSGVGASGALYAIRRADFRALAPGTILDDFEIPMATVRIGRRIVLQAAAQAIDELESDLVGESRRKLRTLTGNFQSMARNRWLFSPWQNRVWWQFISHKVTRLVVPYALVGAFIASCLLSAPIYRFFALSQIAFYILGLTAIVSPRFRASRLASAAGLFVETNAAAVVALWRFIRGNASAVWVTRDRQHTDATAHPRK